MAVDLRIPFLSRFGEHGCGALGNPKLAPPANCWCEERCLSISVIRCGVATMVTKVRTYRCTYTASPSHNRLSPRMALCGHRPSDTRGRPGIHSRPPMLLELAVHSLGHGGGLRAHTFCSYYYTRTSLIPSPPLPLSPGMWAASSSISRGLGFETTTRILALSLSSTDGRGIGTPLSSTQQNTVSEQGTFPAIQV